MRASIAASARCCSSAGPRAAAPPRTAATRRRRLSAASAPVVLRPPPAALARSTTRRPVAAAARRCAPAPPSPRASGRSHPTARGTWARERGVLGVALVARPCAEARRAASGRTSRGTTAARQAAPPSGLVHRLEANGTAVVVLERPPRDAAAAAGRPRRERPLRPRRRWRPRRSAAAATPRCRIDRRAAGARAAGCARRAAAADEPRASSARAMRSARQAAAAQIGAAQPQHAAEHPGHVGAARLGGAAIAAVRLAERKRERLDPANHSLKEQGRRRRQRRKCDRRF